MAPRGERTHLRSPTAKEQAVPAPEAPPAAPPVWDAVFVLPKTAEWEPAAAEESGDIELGSMREKDFQDIGEAKMFRRLLRRLTASGVERRTASIQFRGTQPRFETAARRSRAHPRFETPSRHPRYKCYASIQRDEVYVRVRCPEARVAAQADIRNFAMKLDPARLEHCLAAGLPACGIAPIDIGTTCGGEPVSALRPVDFIYGKYDRDEALQPLYAVPAGASSPFRSMHRLKLLGNVVCSNRRFGGCGIALPKRILKGEILAFIPLHDADERAALYDAWVRAPWYARPSSLPFDAYKDYFGEQQGLYQVFQAHITDYFLVLCVFAVASEALAHALGERTVAAAVAHACFAFALCVWSTALLVTWSRKEKRVALEWGMTDFEDDEPPRPQFKGRIVKSPVDGGEEIFYHPKKRDGGVYGRPRRSASGTSIRPSGATRPSRSAPSRRRSWSCSSSRSSWACRSSSTSRSSSTTTARCPRRSATRAASRSSRGAASSSVGRKPENEGVVGARLQEDRRRARRGVSRPFFPDPRSVSFRCTEKENWRTETEFRDKLIIRLFVFNFINAYGSLYFTVFVQEHIDPKVKNIGNEWHCLENDCFYDLRYNVLFIMVISLVAATTTGTIIPLVTRKLNERREGGHEAEMSGPEWEYLLLEYDETQDSISEYMAGAINYGYIALFGVAAPVVVPIGALNNLIILRLDAYKYLTGYRRIEPRGVQDIGSFKSVYSFLNVAAALTNCAIVVYLPGLVNEGRRDACYMAAVAVMLGCVVAGRLASEDDDHDVALQVRRQEFINDKLIDRVADEDEKYHLDHEKPCDFTVDDRDDGPYHAALGDAFRRGPSTFAATNPIEGAGTDVV